MNIPTISDIRRAAAGAAVGARLALGPERWLVMRATWRVLAIFGRLALVVYLIAVISIIAGA